MSKCKKHPTVDMTIGPCHRCDGEGYTQSDLDDMDNPLEWHKDGNCWECKGSGHGFLECHVCEEEAREQEEMEHEREMMEEQGLAPLQRPKALKELEEPHD